MKKMCYSSNHCAKVEVQIVYSPSCSKYTNIGLKKIEELNFTDNFKVKLVHNGFLVNINYQLYMCYILNPFTLGDQKMVKIVNQNAIFSPLCRLLFIYVRK